MSPDLLLAVGLAALLMGLVLAARKAKAHRSAAARTVTLEIDDRGARRTLADGRAEEALWAHLREIELVRTPVRTADSARAFLVLDSGKEVEAFNQAALTNKCLQFSNGAMYPIAGMPLWEPVHDMKLDALEDIIDEAQGSPILCAYAYRSDAERIMTRFKDLRPINLTECKSESALTNAMHRWKTGDCQLMIGHPASMGHGIDGLQKNGHILVWYGLNWSLDLYEQFNARVRRQGQGAPVMCHRLLMRNTLDQAQALALDEKATTQAGLRNAVKQYRQSRGV